MIGGAIISFLMAGAWIVIAARAASEHRAGPQLAASWMAVLFAIIGVLAVAAAQPQP